MKLRLTISHVERFVKVLNIAENFSRKFDQMDQFPNWEWQIQCNVALFICGLCPLIHRFYPPLPLTFSVFWLSIMPLGRRIKESRFAWTWKNWKFNLTVYASFSLLFCRRSILPSRFKCYLVLSPDLTHGGGAQVRKTRAFCYTMGRLTIAQKSTIWEENSAKHLFGRSYSKLLMKSIDYAFLRRCDKSVLPYDKLKTENSKLS